MNYSQKILNFSESPKHRVDFVLENSVTIHLVHNKAKLRISFETIEINDEICFGKIGYQTDLLGPYLGLLDGFVELMHKRPLEAIDRFPSKELDYYLRDKVGEPSLSGLDEKFYEILAIGEEIKKNYFKIDKDHSPKLVRNFLDLSVSEQLEFVEEIFSYFVYNTDSEFNELEIVDIEETPSIKLFFNNLGIEVINSERLEQFLTQKLGIGITVEISSFDL